MRLPQAQLERFPLLSSWETCQTPAYRIYPELFDFGDFLWRQITQSSMTPVHRYREESVVQCERARYCEKQKDRKEKREEGKKLGELIKRFGISQWLSWKITVNG